ncbi:MAG: hypothetical protein ACT4N2_03740 [Hyphomicrobium sp.]
MRGLTMPMTLPRSLIAGLLVLLAGQSAEARRLSEDTSRGYVVAESRFGNGTVSGAIREARFGLEVQLPGGSWVGCRRSCSETLRVETVDFWEKKGGVAGGGALQNECGVFGCLDFGF